jgi:hypothetical protein
VTRSDFISGIVLLVFGLVFLFVLIPHDIEAGPEGVLPPSLVPKLMVGGIALLSLILIVKNWKRPDGQNVAGEQSPISISEVKAMAWAITIIGASILLFLWGGALPAATLLVIGLMLAMGERRVLPLVVTPVTLLIGAYLLFYKLLGTSIE